MFVWMNLFWLFVFLFLPVEVINLELPVAIIGKSVPTMVSAEEEGLTNRRRREENCIMCFEPLDPIILLLIRTLGYISQ